jgi:hypothetical protein
VVGALAVRAEVISRSSSSAPKSSRSTQVHDPAALATSSLASPRGSAARSGGRQRSSSAAASPRWPFSARVLASTAIADACAAGSTAAPGRMPLGQRSPPCGSRRGECSPGRLRRASLPLGRARRCARAAPRRSGSDTRCARDLGSPGCGRADAAHSRVRADPRWTPPVDAFWSLTPYDDKGFPVEILIDLNAIGDRDALTFNRNGCSPPISSTTAQGPRRNRTRCPRRKEPSRWRCVLFAAARGHVRRLDAAIGGTGHVAGQRRHPLCRRA